MSNETLLAVMFGAGALIGAVRRWIPPSGYAALGLCALPPIGVALAARYC